MSKLSTQVEMAEMASWTPKERKAALSECLAATAENMMKCAHIVGAMESAGDDVSSYPESFLAFMRRIRSGGMLPEAYINYEGRLRKCISQLPMPDQRDLVGGKKVPLVVVENGKVDVMKYDPRDLQPIQIKQVFDADHIRSEGEQRAWIEAQKTKEAPAHKPELDVIVKRSKGCIVVRGVELTVNDLAKYVAELT